MITVEKAMELENNSSVKGCYAVSDISLRPFKEKEGCFLMFILQDKTGRIQAKIWDGAEKAKELLQEEAIISIDGKVNLFGGKNQIVVEHFTILDDYNLEEFIICSPKDPDKMLNELKSIMDNSIRDENIQRIWGKYYENDDFMHRFKFCPGGKGDVHHAYIYGLLEHTLSVMKICQFYGNQFENQHINKDVLLFGAFLHDLGKMESYNYKVSIRMTDVGRLFGHTTLGFNSFLKIVDSCDKIPIEDAKELKKTLGHMILSHHGSYEFEAVRLPMTQEAILLAQADNLDSEINHTNKLLDAVVDGWSSYDHMRDKMYYLRKQEIFKEEIKKPLIRRKSKNENPLFDYSEEQ